VARDPQRQREDDRAWDDAEYERRLGIERRDRVIEKTSAGFVVGRDTEGNFVGQDKPTLTGTMQRLDTIKGEHTHLHGERTDVNAAVENAQWMEKTFAALGFDYEDVHAAGMGLGLQLADELVRLLNSAGELSESDFRKRLMVQFGDAWVDGLLVGAVHRKAVES